MLANRSGKGWFSTRFIFILAVMHATAWGGTAWSAALEGEGAAIRGEATAPAPLENGQNESDDQQLRRVELATVGFDMITQAPIVLLREPQTGEVVPIWVGIGEARAISWALNGYQPPRPMTHDLTATLLKELSADLVDVIVDDLRNNTFHGKLKLRVKGESELRTIDTRPSDGLALALRLGAEIHVADRIFKETPKYDFLPPDESMQVVHALGITVVKPTDRHREQFGLPKRAGVVVTRVSGVAKERGVELGDFIVQVNNRTPTSPMEFFEAVRSVRPGHAVPITYVREGRERTVELPAEEVPTDPSELEPPAGTLKV